MSKTKRTLGVSLQFQRIRCKCGARRIRSQPCPDCQRPAERSEVDHAVLRRRELLRDFSDWQRGEGHPSFTLKVTEPVSVLLAELGTLIEPAVRAAVMDHRPEPLRELLTRVEATKEGLQSWPRVRPHVEKRRVAIRVTDGLWQAIERYIDSCTAATPVDAQRYGAEMQRALDETVELRHRLAEIEEAEDHLDYKDMESFMSSLIEAGLRKTGMTLNDVVNGHPTLNSLFDVAPAKELGLVFVLAAAAADDLDREGYHATFRLALEYYRQHLPELSRLAADPDFLEALADADMVTANAVWQAHAALEHAQSEVQRVSATSTLMADLVEGPGALVARVALLLSGTKNQPISKLTQDNATTHIDRVATCPDLAFFVSGVDTHLRVARSHNQLKLDGDTVIAIRQGKPRQYSTIELVDTVLHCLETVSAVVLALKQALTEAGVEADLADLDAIGLDELAMARIVVQQLYGDEVRLELQSSVLQVHIVGAPDLNPLALVAATGPFLRSAETFVVTQDTAEGQRIVTGSAGRLRESWPEDDTDRGLQVVRLMAECRVDGQPAAGAAEIRSALVRLAIPVLTKTQLTLDDGRILRKLIACARDLGDGSLQAALRKSMRRMTGDPIPAPVIQELRSWAQEPTEWRL